MRIHSEPAPEHFRLTQAKTAEKPHPRLDKTMDKTTHEDTFQRHGTFVSTDINQDGRDEIIHQNLKRGVVAYTPHETPDSEAGPYESFPETHIQPDYMGDPSWKLIGAGRYGWNHSEALFFQNKSTGALIANTIGHDDFNENQTLKFPKGFSPEKYEVVGVSDFNNDRHSDIFLRDRKSGELFVWLLKEDHMEDIEEPRTVIPFDRDSGIGPEWKILGIGSFHKDGRSDIVSHHPDGMTKVSIYQGVHRIGETMFEDPEDPDLDSPAENIVGVGDIDGDGASDLLSLDEMGLLSVTFMNGIYPQREDELFYISHSIPEGGHKKHHRNDLGDDWADDEK